MYQVKKRNGKVTEFNIAKIANAGKSNVPKINVMGQRGTEIVPA